MGIPERLAEIQEQITIAAGVAGRDPGGIRLVAVTKTVSTDDIVSAVNAGAVLLGENRVQEAQRKFASKELRDLGYRIEWHLIGHLQKNKAKTSVQLFHLIHTVDSAELAEELNRHAAASEKKQRILVQIKLSDETAKYGAAEQDLLHLLEKIGEMDHLVTEGLMTMPPYFDDAERTRPYFRRLRELRDRAAGAGFALPELSMGMSHDFRVAIEEGATMVRIGSAIFGRRS